MEWQPIETAPRDGTSFLCYYDGEPFVAWWHSPDVAFVWIAPHRINYTDDAYIFPEYWMPLPNRHQAKP